MRTPRHRRTAAGVARRGPRFARSTRKEDGSMSQSRQQQKVLQYLNEAHASELALVRVLQSQIAMAPRGSYRNALETHLGETRRHAQRLERRAQALGEGSNPVAAVVVWSRRPSGRSSPSARRRWISPCGGRRSPARPNYRRGCLEYHLPFAKPPNAIRPTSAMISPIHSSTRSLRRSRRPRERCRARYPRCCLPCVRLPSVLPRRGVAARASPDCARTRVQAGVVFPTNGPFRLAAAPGRALETRAGLRPGRRGRAGSSRTARGQDQSSMADSDDRDHPVPRRPAARPRTVQSASTRTATRSSSAGARHTTALCRCGKSRLRPFCDGTHNVDPLPRAQRTRERPR